MSKDIFTTGEAAKICQVSQQTIIRCFDAGDLEGFRVPGSRFRRIPRASLLAFCRKHGIPCPELEEENRAILLSDESAEKFGFSAGTLKRIIHCDNGFSAGRALLQGERLLTTLIINTRSYPPYREVLSGLKKHEDQAPKLVLLLEPKQRTRGKETTSLRNDERLNSLPYQVEVLAEEDLSEDILLELLRK